MKRRPENDPRPVDWDRVRIDPAKEPEGRARPPFRFGGDVERETGGPEIDPWKALLERGSMQEVLASVRRVAGLPDEDPDDLPAAASARGSDDESVAPAPSATARRRPVAASRPAPGADAGRSPPEAGSPATSSPRPTPAARPGVEERARARAAADVTPLPDDERAGIRRRRIRPAAPPDDGTGTARANPEVIDPAPATTVEPRVIPRRPGPASTRPRREIGPFGIGVLLVVGLAVGVGFGVVARIDQWTMPWPISFAEVEPGAGDAVSGALPAPSEQASAESPSEDPLDDTALTAEEIAIAPPPAAFEDGAGGPLLAEDEPETPAADVAAASEVDTAALDVAPLFIGRVFIHYSTDGDDEEARGRALEVARGLEQRGYRVAAVRPVDFAIQSSSVRYFFTGDLEAAARLQEDLPASVATGARVVDFTSYEPRPRPGTIELWLDGAS